MEEWKNKKKVRKLNPIIFGYIFVFCGKNNAFSFYNNNGKAWKKEGKKTKKTKTGPWQSKTINSFEEKEKAKKANNFILASKVQTDFKKW